MEAFFEKSTTTKLTSNRKQINFLLKRERQREREKERDRQGGRGRGTCKILTQSYMSENFWIFSFDSQRKQLPTGISTHTLRVSSLLILFSFSVPPVQFLIENARLCLITLAHDIDSDESALSSRSKNPQHFHLFNVLVRTKMVTKNFER